MDKIELLDDIQRLFQVDDYEEVMYPIIRNYMLYRLGKFPYIGWYERDTINKAFMILGSSEHIEEDEEKQNGT